MTTTRTECVTITLPADLVAELDRFAGERTRDQVIEDALRAAIPRLRQAEALRTSAGILPMEKYPHWATGDLVSQWVHDLRRGKDVPLPIDDDPPTR